MHPGFNIIMRLNTTKQWMRLIWQYDTSVIIALRLKLSMTVCQKKNRQACNDSNNASGDFLRRKNARLPKSAQRLACAALLKVRTNGLAK